MVKLALLILPPFLRKGKLFELVKILVYPFAQIHRTFLSFRDYSLSRLDITGQVISLEDNLNAEFFLKNREIYITDVPAGGLVMYNDEEPFPGLVMYNDGEYAPEQVTWNNDGEGRYDGDFVVNIPSFLKDYEREIRTFLDTYKVVGRKYIINIYDYE